MQSSWSPIRQGFCWPTRSGARFDAEIVSVELGYVEIIVSGPTDKLLPLKQQAGGHRWQRVPPTEKRDRVHTSTVTVAVLSMPSRQSATLRSSDLEWETMRGSGAGGQHRNMTESAVRVRHRPTGLCAYACSERSQHRNRDIALEVLSARVHELYEGAKNRAVAQTRSKQIGSGMRGDKIRTYRVRDDLVIDHIKGCKLRLRDVKKGLIS